MSNDKVVGMRCGRSYECARSGREHSPSLKRTRTEMNEVLIVVDLVELGGHVGDDGGAGLGRPRAALLEACAQPHLRILYQHLAQTAHSDGSQVGALGGGGVPLPMCWRC